MKYIFVDTSAWDAIADRDDPHHDIAIAFKDEITTDCRLLVTNYILDELYTLLLMNLGYDGAVRFKQQLDLLMKAGIVEILWVSEEVAIEAWEVFERFNKDKRWSFTDCVSYSVMKKKGISEAFVFDQDFAQMGFLCRP